MHDAETHAVLVEHRPEHAAHCALLAPDLDAHRLLGPVVPAVGTMHSLPVLRRIIPACALLQLSRLVYDPLPWDHALLASLLEHAVHALHGGPVHRGDHAGGEELVTDASAGDRLRGFGCFVHGID